MWMVQRACWKVLLVLVSHAACKVQVPRVDFKGQVRLTIAGIKGRVKSKIKVSGLIIKTPCHIVVVQHLYNPLLLCYLIYTSQDVTLLRLAGEWGHHHWLRWHTSDTTELQASHCFLPVLITHQRTMHRICTGNRWCFLNLAHFFELVTGLELLENLLDDKWNQALRTKVCRETLVDNLWRKLCIEKKRKRKNKTLAELKNSSFGYAKWRVQSHCTVISSL